MTIVISFIYNNTSRHCIWQNCPIQLKEPLSALTLLVGYKNDIQSETNLCLQTFCSGTSEGTRPMWMRLTQFQTETAVKTKQKMTSKSTGVINDMCFIDRIRFCIRVTQLLCPHYVLFSRLY